MRLQRRFPVSICTALAAMALCAGCGGPEGGWRPLWRDSWEPVRLGDRWEHGLPAHDLALEVRGESLLRATLVNPGSEPGSVLLLGEGPPREWRVAPGAVSDVEARLGSGGRYRVQGSAGMLVCSPRLGTPVAEPRRLVLIVVDTLRADHVGWDLTPGLMAQFERGRRWSSAMANASWTLPSVASLFVARPVLDLTTPEGDLVGVPEGLATWAEALTGRGWSGLGVVANYSVSALNGFARGFSTFIVPGAHGAAGPPDAAWVISHARQWLASRQGEDVFLYLHLMDPHEPYRDHAGTGRVAPPLASLAHRQRQATAGEAALLQGLYRGEVRHVDEVLAPFLADLPAEAVVALTSDHGESLGEHGCWGHGLSLYEPELRVPLLLRGPGVEAGESSLPVQLLDLAPTVLRLAGVEPPAGMLGRSLLQGGSAVPKVAATFGAGPLRWAWREGERKVILHTRPQPGLGPEPRSRMVEGRPLPEGVFVFDLASDAGEERPGPLEGVELTGCGRAFSATAGRMVPGLQVLLWARPGAVELRLEIEGGLEVIQTWSTGAMAVERTGDGVTVRCSEAFPLCAVAGATRPGAAVAPVAGAVPWRGADSGVGPWTPEVAVGRAALWRNPDRERLISGHLETLERLRALGYLE